MVPCGVYFCPGLKIISLLKYYKAIVVSVSLSAINTAPVRTVCTVCLSVGFPFQTTLALGADHALNPHENDFMLSGSLFY